MRKLLSLLLVLPFLVAGPAFAAYLQSDGEAPSRTSETRRPPERIVPPERRPWVPEAYARLVRELDVGQPYVYGHATIFPLTLRRPRAGGIRTLDEALRNGWIVVDERAEAQVPEIRVRNNSGQWVFLMSGEVIAGGKQNRMIRNDVLLPPRSGFIRVPVYCAEQNRWSGRPRKFAAAEHIAHPGLRRRAAAGASQDDIWGGIAESSRKLKASSPTRDYRVVYEGDVARRELPNFRRCIQGFCRPQTVGAVVVLGRRIHSVDLFADPALFRRLWNRISYSYWVDCVGCREPVRWSDRDAVRRFLQQTLHARFARRHTPGAGDLYGVSGVADGTALVWSGRVVHAALFRGPALRIPGPVPLPRPVPELWK